MRNPVDETRKIYHCVKHEKYITVLTKLTSHYKIWYVKHERIHLETSTPLI